MGIDTRVYVVCGVKVNDYDTDFSKAYDDVYDSCPIDIVLDGMCGDYMVFGKILYESGNFRYDCDDNNEDKVIDITNLADIEKEYKLEFERLFPKFKHYVEQPFKLMTFTHYS